MTESLSTGSTAQPTDVMDHIEREQQTADSLAEDVATILDDPSVKGLARFRIANSGYSEGIIGSAEDVVQSFFVRLYARASKSELILNEPAAYAKTSIGRLILDLIRRGEVTLRHDTEDIVATADAIVSTASAESVAMSNLMLDNPHLVAAIETLPIRQRTAVVLYYLEDRSVTEVAVAMNISKGAVKSSVSRGLAALRVAMDATPERN